MELNIQDWGLGFTSPNPLGQPLWPGFWCVNDLFQFCAVAVHTIPCSHYSVFTLWRVHIIPCSHLTVFTLYRVHSIPCSHYTVFSPYRFHTIPCLHNRTIARWPYLTTTTTIHFGFALLFKFVNPAEDYRTIALICIRKQQTQGFW